MSILHVKIKPETNNYPYILSKINLVETSNDTEIVFEVLNFKIETFDNKTKYKILHYALNGEFKNEWALCSIHEISSKEDFAEYVAYFCEKTYKGGKSK